MEENIGDRYGILEIDFTDKDEGEGYIYGYPGQVSINGEQENANKKMYGMHGTWTRHNEEIRYEISTTPGQGGSPVFIRKN